MRAMANLSDTPPTGSWRRNHNISWVGSVINAVAVAVFGAAGVVAGAKAAGMFSIGDTEKRIQAWSKKKV